MAKFLGDITHTEKYTKDGVEKKKYTNIGGLFLDEEKGYYSVKLLGQWLQVFPKKEAEPKQKQDEINLEDIPF